MPMSAAAIAGIRHNGNRWRYRMNGLIKDECLKLGELNDRIGDRDDGEQTIVSREESEPVVISLRTKVSKWLDRQRRMPDEIVTNVKCRLDDLEMVEDCGMGEINYALNDLFDEFDYWRILTG